jgi:hypothetical protein
MTEPLILKRAPVGDNPDDYSVLENGTVVGRIFKVPGRAIGPPLDVGERPPRRPPPRSPRLRADARSRDGSVRQELAQKLGIHALLRGLLGRRRGTFVFRNVPYAQCLKTSRRTASVELPTRDTAAASSSLLQPRAPVQ